MNPTIFPKPFWFEPDEWYEYLDISYLSWEYLERIREDNPPKLQTVEGYRVAYQHDTYCHSWDTYSPVILGLVFKGKKECLGQGIWDACTGEELVHLHRNLPRKWKLKGY